MTTISIDLHLFQAAIRALHISAPVYSAIYTDAGDVAITTRDGTLIWRPADTDAVSDEEGNCKQLARVADDLTQIPQVGDATEAALNEAGIFTFTQLANADIQLLLSIMPRRTLRCVVLYIQKHHPELSFRWKPKEA